MLIVTDIPYIKPKNTFGISLLIQPNSKSMIVILSGRISGFSGLGVPISGC